MQVDPIKILSRSLNTFPHGMIDLILGDLHPFDRQPDL